MKNFILTFSLLFLVGLAWGQNDETDVTYFVDGNNGVDAEDRGTTLGNAWRTIEYAVGKANEIAVGQTVSISIVSTLGGYDEPLIPINRPMTLTRAGGVGIENEGESIIVRTEDNALFQVVTSEGLTVIGDFNFESEDGDQTAILVEQAGRLNVVRNTFSGFATAIRTVGTTESVNVNANDFQDFTTGILISSGSSVDNLIIQRNRFADASGSLAINNEATQIINAEYNSWEQIENITSLISEGNVDYSPYLTLGTDIEPAIPGFQGDLSSVFLAAAPSYGSNDRNELQEAYNQAEVEEVLLPPNASYDALDAEKNATLLIENGEVDIDNVTVDIEDGSLSVNGALTINESLTLARGDLQTVDEGSQITLGSNVSSPNEDAGQMRGNFTTIRPLGSDGVAVLGVSISGSDNSDEISITRINGPAGTVAVGTSESIDVRWIIVPSANLNSRVVSFTWREEDDDEPNLEKVVIWRLDEGSDSWQPVSGDIELNSVGTSVQTVSVSDVDVFPATWTVSDVNEPLPVTLTDFSAYLDESSVRLRWTTASEINSDYFRTERSTDGIAYEPLGRTKAAGESQQEQNYRYVDEGVTNRLSGIVYYRLKMVDFDGSFEYSPTVAVSLSGNAPLLVYASRDGAFKLFADLPETTYTIQVSDLSGQIVYQAPLSAQPDVREYALPVPPLSSSIYTLRCIGFQDVQVGRFRVE